MKTSLTHIKERKRMELETIVRMIRKAINVEMIILFGSYARGNAVEKLAWLAERVKILQEFTEKHCQKKIASFGS